MISQDIPKEPKVGFVTYKNFEKGSISY